MRFLVIVLVVLLAVGVVGNIYYAQLGLAERQLSTPFVKTQFKLRMAKHDRPEDVALLYMHTVSSGDYFGSLGYLTPRYGELMRDGLNRFVAELAEIPEEKLIDFEVKEQHVYGGGDVLLSIKTVIQVEFANHYDIETTDWDFYLVREGNEWRIDHITEVETTTRQVPR